MLGNLSGLHLVAILFVILLLFGAPKLPGLAKSLGQSMRILKQEVGGESAEPNAAGGAAQDPAAPEQPATSDPALRADPGLQ